jgi:hypothetical protein
VTYSTTKSIGRGKQRASSNQASTPDEQDVVTLEQIWPMLDAYDETRADNRRPASSLDPGVKAALEKHLAEFCTAKRFPALTSAIRGHSKCLAAKLSKEKTEEPALGLANACAYCEQNGTLCVMKSKNQKPLIMPQRQSKREGLTADDPNYWLPLQLQPMEVGFHERSRVGHSLV